jgi:hypothetical protein
MSAPSCIPSNCNPIPPICPTPLTQNSHKTAGLAFSHQVAYLNPMISNFIYQCDSVLSDLNAARTTELFDMSTSNQTLVGYFISNMSYAKNHEAANRVDALQREAGRVNQAVQSSGLPIGCYLNVYVSGNPIRHAENGEHSFFFDWFSAGTYSSMGSANTVAQIQTTISRVEQLRSQALALRSAVSFGGMGNFQYPNFPTF